ncbi:MAG: flagellar filament capping protein FliD [Clostridium sp.]|uniref:flagellar filament capping protein FliD n=1 Tax=Clostridium sp. TaxID=1506 RepID=UPI003050A054
MRITGMATGLDVDQIVKDTMRPHRIKIQQQQQQKEILEIKQKLYREVISSSRDFYNKYFDVTKSDSILLSKNWQGVSFESSNAGAVTVTGSSDAKAGKYTVTGTSATAAKATVTELGTEVVVNGEKFTLKNGATEREKAKDLNEQLKAKGINVTVRYSDLAGGETGGNKSGFVFESTVLGKDGTFTIGGTTTPIGTGTLGKDATAGTVTLDVGKTGKELEDYLKGIKINGELIGLEFPEAATDEDRIKILNEKLSSKNLKAVYEGGKLKIDNTVLGELAVDKIPKIEAGGIEIPFKNGENATKSEVLIVKGNLNGKFIIDGNAVNINLPTGTDKEQQDYLNNLFKNNNIGVTAEVVGGNIKLTSADAGVNSKFDVKKVEAEGTTVTGGTNANIIIKDDKGGVYTHKGNSNTVTLDGITFTINGEIPKDGVNITGKNQVSGIKDMIVGFVNDYNKMMERLNSLTMTKNDKSFKPLTDEQKKEMSETEIKIWNEKVEKGQLNRDSDVTRIANSMKSAMRGLVEGGNLEKIGIAPVKDYQGTKNGTFTIDESKLTEALEKDLAGVMNQFISMPDSSITDETSKYNETGIAQRLKKILYDETVTVSAGLIKKAGVEGTSSAGINELTKKMETYDRKMKDMEKDFKRREQALYSKYAVLETMMNKLNSQQSYLMSQLGQ